MGDQSSFIEKVTASYNPKGAFIFLGAGLLDGEVIARAKVNLPLKMMNRHGLIAGATGTGKTRTLQLIAEQLSDVGVPVFLLDVKGDLSGLHQPGESNPALVERGEALEWPFVPSGFPIELFSLSGKVGNPMRLTVEDFGPVMLSRILDLNDTQTGVLAAVFKYAEDTALPLVDFADLKKLLSYLTDGSGAEEIKDSYGRISGSTSGTILRKLVALEQQGVSDIFGEKEFDIDDLFGRVDGKGVISLLNISDIQDQPILFSTFLLSLLAQLFKNLPEVGDLDKPKLVFFFEEAHLLFKDAPKAFLTQVEQIVRLIRSKGVGVFFCTQSPTDIPESVLGQLGNRVQHALRAFTPNDAEALRKTVKTYPRSDFYEIDRVLTSLGTGQALITVLNDKGIPTEVVATHLIPPRAVMGPVDTQTYDRLVKASPMYTKYHEAVDRRSASEILEEKMQAHAAEEAREAEIKQTAKKSTSRRSTRQTPLEAAQKAATTTLAREATKLLARLANGLVTAMFRKRR
ncbi:MAG TPA: helicase HerA-like domain-containing protein [Parapedobacter sp.]|uniref:helicase HerA-like domain-containing protein n=1 Tax=Parapedobacter sp. TaxID=1958893 RepID=UPI002C4C2A28|nr:helicase HerA-like domain-containing protein [Parapedobacter sp.]HWK56062.1 helicase HerA-like domain-containing protein [Parapedobacter sp.]